MTTRAEYAVIRGRRMYTLRRYLDPWGQKTALKFVGYCDAERVGFFRTKKEFEAFVDRHATRDLSPQQLAAIEAEQRGTAEGYRLLDVVRMAGYGKLCPPK